MSELKIDKPEKKIDIRRLVLLIIILVGAAALANWGLHRANHVSTDDARVDADMIDVRSKATGWLIDLPVALGHTMQPGDLIAQLDTREIVLRLQELEATVAAKSAQINRAEAEIDMVRGQTSGNVQAASSQLSSSEAHLEAAIAEDEFKNKEWLRAQSLRKQKIISEAAWEDARNSQRHARQSLQQSRAGVATAIGALDEAKASEQRILVLEQGIIAAQHEKNSLQLAVQQTQVRFQDHRIESPTAGFVDKVFVNAGEYLVPGQRIMLMHDPASVSINANIKETEVRHLRVGQRVALSFDAYPDISLTGTLEKIGNAATSEFSLLPATNPSGNFTKVTQRIPITISVEQRDNLLKPGMMVEVDIDVRDS